MKRRESGDLDESSAMLDFLRQNNAITIEQRQRFADLNVETDLHDALLHSLGPTHRRLLCTYLRNNGRWKEAAVFDPEPAIKTTSTRLKGQVRLELTVEEVLLDRKWYNIQDICQQLYDAKVPEVKKKKKKRKRFNLFQCFRPSKLPQKYTQQEFKPKYTEIHKKSASLCKNIYEKICSCSLQELISLFEADLGILVISVRRLGQDKCSPGTAGGNLLLEAQLDGQRGGMGEGVGAAQRSPAQEDSGYEADSTVGDPQSEANDMTPEELKRYLSQETCVELVVVCPRLLDLAKLNDLESEVTTQTSSFAIKDARLRFNVDCEDVKLVRRELG